MQVALKDFLQSGTFGFIESAMSRAAIEQRLGPPPQWSANARTFHHAAIWKYGAVEFHFQSDMLWMIFMDDLNGVSHKDKS